MTRAFEPLFPPPGKRVGRPNLPEDPEAVFGRLRKAFDRAWLSNNGPLVTEFEAELAERCGTRHALAVCNATIGLELVLRTLPQGSEVVMPSYTFAATIQAARWVGLRVRCVDVDPETHLMTRDAALEAIGPDTSAVMGVHLWGEVCDLGDLGVPVFQDGAHAMGWEGAPLGSYGRASVLSFHATKFLNAFEGGAILTDDDELAETLGSMRNFGLSGAAGSHGTNGKMSEASGAMGLASLERIDEILERNRLNYRAYREALEGQPGVRIVPLDVQSNNCQYVVVEVEPAGDASIDALVEALDADGVHTRTYFRPCGHQILDLDAASFPVSERLSGCVAILPTGLQVSPEDADRIGRRVALRVAALRDHSAW